MRDSYWFTFKTFIYTLLLAIPVPLFIYLCGDLLSRSTTGFSHASGISLIAVSQVVFLLVLSRYLLMPKGLTEIHFRWKESLCNIIRQKLNWFIPLFALSWFFINLTQHYVGSINVGAINIGSNNINLSELGRLFYLLLLILFTVFFVSSHRGFKNNPYSLKHRKTFFLFYFVSLLILASLMVITVMGYYFSSVRILDLLIGAFFIVFYLFIAYFLALRWLTLTQARLSYQQMLDNQHQEQEAEINSGVSVNSTDELSNELNSELSNDSNNEFADEMNIQQIKTQVGRLLNWLLIGSILFALAWHFREVSSIFNTLDNINLWTYHIDAEQIGNISLLDVFMSLLVILLTIGAIQNLPGLFELAIYNPLDIDAGVRYAASRIIQYIIIMIGFIVAVSWLGLSWSDVQWLVTAVSVGLGFGLKEIFSNFFSGLILLFERPIRIGDVVTIGAVSGTVSKIQTRATTIIDWDKKELIIPNQSLILENLVNWTLTNHTTRVTFMLGLAYDTEVEQAQNIIMETIKKHPLVLADPEPSALLINFGDSSLDFEIRVYVAETDYRMQTKHELHINLVNTMRENHIVIPFPQRDINIKNSE